jgi:hypothetical protein
MYLTDEPCDGCRKFISGSGLVKVVWPAGTWYPGGEPKKSWLRRLLSIMGI